MKKSLLTIFAPKPLGSTRELRTLFADNGYLTVKEPPEALVFIPMREVLFEKAGDPLNEKNAEILKHLANSYQIKTIVVTRYPAPNGRNALQKEHAWAVAAGISEIYYDGIMDPGALIVSPNDFKVTELPLIDVYQTIARKAHIGKEKCIIFDKEVITKLAHNQNGFNSVSSLGELRTVVSNTISKRQP